jgi:DNA-directed RNA polymerase specialized sigma24 family protein
MKKKPENTDLLRKLAWKYHKSTGLDWNDLFQEAALGYLEAIRTYDPKRGAPSTHIWTCVTSRLSNYAKKERCHSEPLVPIGDIAEDQEYKSPENIFEALSTEARQIVEVIFAAPETYDVLPQREAKSRIGIALMQKKNVSYLHSAIERGMREIQLALR